MISSKTIGEFFYLWLTILKYGGMNSFLLLGKNPLFGERLQH